MLKKFLSFLIQCKWFGTIEFMEKYANYIKSKPCIFRPTYISFSQPSHFAPGYTNPSASIQRGGNRIGTAIPVKSRQGNSTGVTWTGLYSDVGTAISVDDNEPVQSAGEVTWTGHYLREQSPTAVAVYKPLF